MRSAKSYHAGDETLVINVPSYTRPRWLARGIAGSYCATSAPPSWLCCSRGMEKREVKPSVVRNVTMLWVGSEDRPTAQDSSG
jgi:hypothetical protein